VTTEAISQFIDINAEKRALGALIGGARLDGLEPWHFHLLRHATIFEAISDLSNDGLAVDIKSVESVLTTLPEQEWGGFAYLLELFNEGDYFGLPNWTAHIKDLAVRRRHLLEHQRGVKRLIEGDDPDLIRADLNLSLMRYSTATESAHPARLERNLDTILDRYAEPVDVWGMRSGIYEIDEQFGGIHKGEEIIVAGEPGAGKTMLVDQIGYQLAGMPFWNQHFNLDRHPGNIYSMEFAETQILDRLIAAQAHVNWKFLKTGRYEDTDQLQRVTAAIERLETVPVHISDATDWTTGGIRADLIRHIEERGVEWAIIDYMGLLKDPGDRETEREKRVSIALHDMARDLNIALLVVDALNKSSMEKRRPGIESVKGSGQKIYDADVVVFLEFPTSKTASPSSRILRFQKVREGDSFRKVPITLNGQEKRFDPA
jgi:replicative DNA helicase